MPSTIECPECQRVLKIATLPAPGKKIRCPKCQAVFPVPDEEEPPTSAIRSRSGANGPARKRVPDEDEDEDFEDRPRRRRPSAPPPVPRSRRRQDDDDDDPDEDEEDDRPRRRKKKAGSGSMMLVLISVGAVVLLGGFALTAFVWPGFLLSDGKGGPDGKQAKGKLPPGPVPAKFKEFVSAAGRFKVLMPGIPRQQAQNIPGGGILNVFLIEELDGAYMAAYADTPVPPGETEAQIQQRLDGARDGAVRNLNGALVRDNRVRLAGKHPGREIEANLPQNKGIVRARFYFVGSRMYQVMVIGTSAWASTPDAATFLDSLALSN